MKLPSSKAGRGGRREGRQQSEEEQEKKRNGLRKLDMLLKELKSKHAADSRTVRKREERITNFVLHFSFVTLLSTSFFCLHHTDLSCSLCLLFCLTLCLRVSLLQHVRVESSTFQTHVADLKWLMINLSAWLPAPLFVCLSVCLSVCLPVCLSVCLSVCLID